MGNEFMVRHEELKLDELNQRLYSSAALMGMLPVDPSYNGSRLIIDDEEAARVEKDLDDAAEFLKNYRAARSAESELTAAVDALESVLCDPDGNVSIRGSEGDIKVIRDALDKLRAGTKEEK